MNLTELYGRPKFVLLRNLAPDIRMIAGKILHQHEFIAMDEGSAKTFLSMIPDPSWLEIKPLITTKGVNVPTMERITDEEWNDQNSWRTRLLNGPSITTRTERPYDDNRAAVI